MKILHFITSIDQKSGGTTAYMQLLASKLGKDTDLLVISGKTLEPVKIENAKTILLDFWSPFSLINTYKSFNKILDEFQPDIVHINGIWQFQTWLFQYSTKQRKIKTVLSTHGMLEPSILKRNKFKKRIAWMSFQKKALESADLLVATSMLEKQNILKLNLRKLIEIVPNGISCSHVKLKDSWVKNNIILFLSRVHEHKGIDKIIQVVYNLKDLLVNFKFVIAGGGEEHYIESLKDKIKELNLTEFFEFPGSIYGDAKWDLYKQADLFILPSLSENFGIVIAESLLVGTPVITTKGTPWQDLQIHKCGWWINNDVESLQESLIQFLSLSEKELEAMGKRGHKLVVENYEISKISNQMLTLYNSLL